MEASKSQPSPLAANKIPKTLAQERQAVTPGEPDSWFESSESQKSFQDEQEPQKVIQSSNTSLILKSVLSANKSQLPQSSKSKQKVSKGEQLQAVGLGEEKQQEEIKELQKRNFGVYYLKLEETIALLAFKMARYRMVNFHQASELKDQGFLEISSKSRSIIIRTTDQKTADEAGERILQNCIYDLNVLNLQINPELQRKLQKLKTLKRQLLKRGVILFKLDYKNDENQLFIGGRYKTSQLKKIQKQIKSYRIHGIRLRQFRNKRSYNLILNQIFDSQFMRKEMMKLSGINLMEMDHKYEGIQALLMMRVTAKTEITPNQFQQFVTKKVRNYFFVACFILERSSDQQKLSVQGQPEIRFIYVKEKNTYKKITYLFIITYIDLFNQHSKLIGEQLQKVGKLMIGIRFFKNLYPQFRTIILDKENCYVRRFPKLHPYSMIVSVKQKKGKKFDWRQIFAQLEQFKVSAADKVQAEQESYIGGEEQESYIGGDEQES